MGLWLELETVNDLTFMSYQLDSSGKRVIPCVWTVIRERNTVVGLDMTLPNNPKFHARFGTVVIRSSSVPITERGPLLSALSAARKRACSHAKKGGNLPRETRPCPTRRSSGASDVSE